MSRVSNEFRSEARDSYKPDKEAPRAAGIRERVSVNIRKRLLTFYESKGHPLAGRIVHNRSSLRNTPVLLLSASVLPSHLSGLSVPPDVRAPPPVTGRGSRASLQLLQDL
ncbi:hypothetical protein MTO96_016344 [Rhipicephalus appendiculatus]